MEYVDVGDRLLQFLSLVEKIDKSRATSDEKNKIGRLFCEIFDRRLEGILVACTLLNGETVYQSFPSKLAFVRYVKTLHPSLAEESDEDALVWYGMKFANVEIKEQREVREF